MRSLTVLFMFCALVAAHAHAQTTIWTCAVERRIENGRTVFPDSGSAGKTAPPLIIATDLTRGVACLLETPETAECRRDYGGVSMVNDVLRLDRLTADGQLDLVNIFERSGRFIRIMGDVQWMGPSGGCVRRPAPSLAIR
jgi:hypothetical protein